MVIERPHEITRKETERNIMNNNNNNIIMVLKSPPFLKREKALVQHSRQKSQPRQREGSPFASFRIKQNLNTGTTTNLIVSVFEIKFRSKSLLLFWSQNAFGLA